MVKASSPRAVKYTIKYTAETLFSQHHTLDLALHFAFATVILSWMENVQSFVVIYSLAVLHGCFTFVELAMKVELLILAHDAHTCAYDMEGISSVLRACRACSVQMNDVSTYSLMVRTLNMYICGCGYM